MKSGNIVKYAKKLDVELFTLKILFEELPNEVPQKQNLLLLLSSVMSAICKISLLASSAGEIAMIESLNNTVGQLSGVSSKAEMLTSLVEVSDLLEKLEGDSSQDTKKGDTKSRAEVERTHGEGIWIETDDTNARRIF